MYYAILQYTILYYTILCYTLTYYIILYYMILHCIYCTILHRTELYLIILYLIILYDTVLYYTILYTSTSHPQRVYIYIGVPVGVFCCFSICSYYGPTETSGFVIVFWMCRFQKTLEHNQTRS